MRELKISSLVVAVLGLCVLTSCDNTSLSEDNAPGTAPADCVPLVISDAFVSMDGISLFWPAQKMNNPKASDPKYVYLAAGREGVVLLGPELPDTAGPFALEAEAIKQDRGNDVSIVGYLVFVNHTFGYIVAIKDFDLEVSLARVELCQQSGTITSQFVFVANPGASGIARDITITAGAHSTKISAPTAPVTVEVR